MNPQAHDPNPTGPEPEALTDAQQADLEAALGALPLAEPTALLDHRVGAALRAAKAAPNGHPTAAHHRADTAPKTMQHPARSRWLTALAVAAVVALLAALGLSLYLQGGTPEGQGPEVVEQAPDTATDPLPEGYATNDEPDPASAPLQQAGYAFHREPVTLHWTRDIDEGLLTSEPGAQPVRALRREDVEQEVWVDPERGVTVQVTRPRQRLVVVKQPTF